MPRQREPMLLKMRRSGLSIGFALQGQKMTGLSVDYQEGAASGEAPQVMAMLNGVLSKGPMSTGSRAGAIVEGMALLDSGKKLPGGKGTTLMDLKSSGLKMGMVMRERRVTGITLDYQDVTGDSEVKALLRVLNDITSGRVYVRGHSRVVRAGGQERRAAVVKKNSVTSEKAREISGEEKEKIITGAVDEALGVLGEDGRRAFLALLEDKYGMKLGDVPARTRGFVGIMRENLGPTANELEKEMVRGIRKEVPVRGSSLPEVVEALRDFGVSEKRGAESPRAEEKAEAPQEAQGTPEPQAAGLNGVSAVSIDYGVGDSVPVEAEPKKEEQEGAKSEQAEN